MEPWCDIVQCWVHIAAWKYEIVLHTPTVELNGTCTYCGIVWCALQLLWKGFLMWVECWGSRRCLIFHPSILSHLSVSSFSSFIISHHDTFDEYFTQAYSHTSQSPHFHLYLIFIKEYLISIFHPSILSHLSLLIFIIIQSSKSFNKVWLISIFHPSILSHLSLLIFVFYHLTDSFHQNTVN